ncbi:hypothetical protein B296_00007378 [Ensete ventricosum]|uniref:Uncharacterized protein n=1 Tax=Ensete ventricosum TaxID=4639 RepID=A0A426ZRU8_ENSVE|nr:hypothetical protein B296_00007378 [Ensete ventricosum]
MQSLKHLKIAWKRRCDPFSPNSALADCRTQGNPTRRNFRSQDDPQEHGHITSNLNNPCMKVDFPRWKEGNPIGWISRVERDFRFYRTADATRVEITAIHLKGDVIQWSTIEPLSRLLFLLRQFGYRTRATVPSGDYDVIKEG